MRPVLVLAAAVALAPAAASAQEAPPLAGRDVKLHIVQPKDPLYFYPEVAQKAHVEGKATTLCTIASGGALSDCVVQSETPPGYGFGPALLRVASNLRADPHANDGSQTAGRKYLLSIVFRLPR